MVVERHPSHPHLGGIAPIRQMDLLGLQIIDSPGMEIIHRTEIFLGDDVCEVGGTKINDVEFISLKYGERDYNTI